MFSKKSTDLIKIMSLTAFAFTSQISIASEAPSASLGGATVARKDEPELSNWEKIQKSAREARLKGEAAEKAKGAYSEMAPAGKKDRQWVTQQSPSAEREANLRAARQAELDKTFGRKPAVDKKPAVEPSIKQAVVTPTPAVASAKKPETPVATPAPVAATTQDGCEGNPPEFKGTPEQIMTCFKNAQDEESKIHNDVCRVKQNFYYGLGGWGTKKPSEKETQEYNEVNEKYAAATKKTDSWLAELNKNSHAKLAPVSRPSC
ncbi:MAG: hypothetical protein K2Y18_08780 [Alphaproteobacteria bacterium]|nr:hypothetical protein [Alphaproteobacteria bacterium]